MSSEEWGRFCTPDPNDGTWLSESFFAFRNRSTSGSGLDFLGLTAVTMSDIQWWLFFWFKKELKRGPLNQMKLLLEEKTRLQSRTFLNSPQFGAGPFQKIKYPTQPSSEFISLWYVYLSQTNLKHSGLLSNPFITSNLSPPSHCQPFIAILCHAIVAHRASAVSA